MALLGRAARRLYDLEQTSPERLRAIARAMMDRRRAEGRGAEVVRAGELAALLALQDVAEDAIRALTEDRPEALDSLLAALDGELGSAGVDELLTDLVEEFRPPLAARRRAATRRALDRRAAVGSLAVLWELNRNPALANLRELFDDRSLAPALYEPAARVLAAALGPAGVAATPNDLLAKLDEPRRASPDSIAGQLAYVLERWPESAGARRERLLRVLDALEEETPRPPPGPGPIELPPEEALRPPRVPEELRPEVHWMHELVLVAKHAHVWLDQLSREHGRLIQRLDEVPDEELARLADLGMTGLWTIGVWERSAASREIKRICGQPDGEASAYSVFDYSVAADLGGEEALEALQERALAHGISLGVDVVPNHFGLDSRWLRDHPERFLSVASCPYPSYTFDGPDLSSDPDVGIYLEDHYYDRTDAAVVFKRVDRLTGEERFVYHGNDGTSTPWNDTAQLDYTRPDVRRAMADIIVGLARRFRVLRFDAAMTLTRLHYQRLWFPAPGAGGAVPSRSEHGMSEEAFEELVPGEFWREVVERVAAEAPDSLLVAEAFWLMEPFFVSELGMDRVYNSAFMHMLRERENALFQRLLRNTVARAPELLRRSVNFLTTPDEASAAEQFGRGDRYFGACALLAAMPGTPLFGHGQIEGLGEKYGMEFRRARSDDPPHRDLVERHRREIVPLLAERHLFAGVDGLALLDFIGVDGVRWDEVFTWRTGRGEDLRLVAYNNSDQAVEGTLRDAGGGSLVSLTGAEAAGAETLTLRDDRHDVELTFPLDQLRSEGLPIRLEAWQALVLAVEADLPPVGTAATEEE